MRYVSGRRRRPRKMTPIVSTIGAVALLLAIFAYSVYEFRKPNTPPDQPQEENKNISAPVVFVPSAPVGDQAALQDVTGSTASGMAIRSDEDGNYYLKVKTSLPDIDRVSQLYEGWLVRPVPYGYFSVGEMVTNDLGEFVLEWAGAEGKSYDDYSQMVITLEAKDGNPDPSGHILEGEFE